MKLDTIKTQFVSAVKTYASAKEKLVEAFEQARNAIVGKSTAKSKIQKLRDTLIAWATEAGVNEATAKSEISRLMTSQGLRLREPKGEDSTDKAIAKKDRVQAVIDYCHEELELTDDKEVASVLLAARRKLEKALKEGK